MKISIVIPTYYKNSHKEVLASILKQASFKDFEIIVVKNGGTKENYYCKKNLKVYEINKAGLDNARNFGVKASSGEIVAFIDDDAIAPNNWLFSIVKAHENIDAPVIGGKVLPKWPNNKKPKWVNGILLAYLSILEGYSNIPTPVHPLDWLAGTNITFKKYIFNRVGYFDENLDRKESQLLSSGEVDLCNRIRENGYEIVFDPSLVVTHVIPQSRLTPQYMVDRAYWQGVSDLLLDKKHMSLKILPKKFDELNSEMKYEKLDPSKAFKSINALCKYARAIGYLQAYIKNFSL